jgi:endonuclease/exonuclease/phosphatase family metal-dependent hydrolase
MEPASRPQNDPSKCGLTPLTEVLQSDKITTMPALPAQPNIPPATAHVSRPFVQPTSQPLTKQNAVPEQSVPTAQHPPTPITLDVLSLNTFALPAPLGKNIAARSERIGASLKGYQIVGLQETFSKDSRYLAVGAESAGISVERHAPTDRRLLNSGLTTLSAYEIVERDFRPFQYASHADALAQKGVSFTRIRLPEGQLIDVYNTHFQAMKDKANSAHEKLGLKIMGLLFSGYDMPRDDIRAHDAEVLQDFIAEKDQGHPVIVTGDFNTQESDPLYDTFKAASGLTDAFRELHPEDPGYTSDGKTNPYKSNPNNRKRVDYIFYRDGKDLNLTPVQSEVVFDKAIDGLFVSDHYGVHTRFELTPTAKD